MFMEQYKQILKFLVRLLMILFIGMLLTTNQMKVHATDYNGSQGGDTGTVSAGGKGIGGGWDRSAVILYIADKQTGEPVSPSVLLYSNKNAKFETAKQANIKSKLVNGHTVDIKKLGMRVLHVPKVPTPIGYTNGTWVSQGNQVKDWLMKYDAEHDIYRYEYYILYAFGDFVLDNIRTAPELFSVVIEAVAVVHQPGDTSVYTVGTVDGLIESINGSHQFIRESMCNCMVTETDRWGIREALSRSSGKHTDSADVISTTGWGMHISSGILDTVGNIFKFIGGKFKK